MHCVEKPGTSLEAMRRITDARQQGAAGDPRRAQLRLAHRPRRGRRRGRRARTSPSCGSASTPRPTTRRPWRKIQEVDRRLPGLYRDVLTYLKERIKEVLTGAGRDDRRAALRPRPGRAARARRRRSPRRWPTSPGVTNLKVEPQVLVPQLDVRLRPEAAARLGLTPGDVRRAATTLVKGTKVGEVYDDQKIFDVVVWGVAEGPRRRLAARARCRSRRPLGDARPAGRRGRRRDRAGPQRDQARGGLAADRRDLQRRRAATWARVAREIEDEGARRCRSTASTTPSSSASTPPAQESRRRLLRPGGAVAARRSCCCIHADFRSLAADGRWSLLTLPVRPDRRRRRRASSAAACCRSARWSGSSPCSASPPATASCWSATTATWRRRRASRSASTWCSAARRSGWRRS